MNPPFSSCHTRLLLLLAVLIAPVIQAAPVKLFDEAPVKVTRVASDVFLVDFGRAAYGNVRLMAPAAGEVTVHFGEALTAGRIERKPPGTVRYATAHATLRSGAPVVAAPPADQRNTEQVSDKHPPAVLTPTEWGVVLPFRWLEIEGWPGELRADQVTRQAAFAATWDDQAASFKSSDALLDRVWELCRYSIKATTFAGVYADGDRERIPYEADAYLNQLSHYATDRDTQMARDTFDWLMKYPTWPTEWAFHVIFMAHADWMHTGDAAWLAPRYEALKPKLLLDRARADGLLRSDEPQRTKNDIVDWPVAERDGYVFTSVNTVVNAFHIRTLALMAELATALKKDADAAGYRVQERAARAALQEKLFDATRGVYRDGEGTEHASQHANLFPLAFGLVPDSARARVTAFAVSRGMACSVYAAQYLLEGLLLGGADEQAVALITAPGDRSWRHMIESGTTITWEAWDQKYKPNQDWNHAWGAAPANVLPRFVLGAQPLVAGWRRTAIAPHPGALTHAEGKIPTPRGPIQIEWTRGENFTLTLALPAGMSANVQLPATARERGVSIDGRAVSARRDGAWWILDEDITGKKTLTTR